MVAIPSVFYTPIALTANALLSTPYSAYYNPNNFEYYNDPVTGALLTRPRVPRARYEPVPIPIPARCCINNCVHMGVAHSYCVPRANHEYPRSRKNSSSNRNSFRISDPSEETAYWRWQSSRPNWQLPRQMPAGWRRPGAPFPNFPSTPAFPSGIVGGPGTPYPTQQYEVNPSRHRRSSSAPESQAELLSRPPNLMRLDNVGGGSRNWQPYQWVAHPYPYPGIPADQFWTRMLPVPWWGADPRIYQTQWQAPQGATAQPAYYLTGGWPLPGADPTWTPGSWNPDHWRNEVPQITGSLRLAPWLIPNPRNGAIPHILWDVCEDPLLMNRVTVRGTLTKFAEAPSFHDRATEPEMSEIKIHIPYMHTNWGPVIARNSNSVRCSDIFRAIYDYLQTSLTRDDEVHILSTPGGRDKLERMEYSAFRRCQMAVIPERERLNGIKRVDVLEGATVFWGMWPSYNEDGTWHLNVGFCPPMSWEAPR